MAIRTDFTAGEVLAAADLNDTFAAKLNLAGGKVLQIVYSSHSTQAQSTSTSYADTGLSASITPSASTSNILVFVSVNGIQKQSGNTDNGTWLNIVRNSTQVSEFAKQEGFTGVSEVLRSSASGSYLDSPNTTSATTYKVQFKVQVSGQTSFVQANSGTSSIVLMEVSA
jgi:hypothetical protein